MPFVGDDIIPSFPKPIVRLPGPQVTHVEVTALRICLKNTKHNESDWGVGWGGVHKTLPTGWKWASFALFSSWFSQSFSGSVCKSVPLLSTRPPPASALTGKSVKTSLKSSVCLTVLSDLNGSGWFMMAGQAPERGRAVAGMSKIDAFSSPTRWVHSPRSAWTGHRKASVELQCLDPPNQPAGGLDRVSSLSRLLPPRGVRK